MHPPNPNVFVYVWERNTDLIRVTSMSMKSEYLLMHGQTLVLNCV